jgi:hypothetical protein
LGECKNFIAASLKLQAASNTITASSRKPKAEREYRIQLQASRFKLQANTEYSFTPQAIQGCLASLQYSAPVEHIYYTFGY